LSLTVSNVLRAVESYILDTNGAVGSTVTIRIVYSEALDQGAVIEESFTVLKTTCNAEVVEFELGAENLLLRKFPKEVYFRHNCRWKFKSTECGYAGATTTCNRTMGACIDLDGGSNISRFGGFPGIPGGEFDDDTTEATIAE